MLDKDGTLRINAVCDYLHKQARIYRSKPDSTEIATPDLAGDRSYNFPLGTLPDKAYQQAVQAFAETLDKTVPDAVPDLSGDHFGRPLYLQMAALLALHGKRPTTAEGLTTALLNHERRYWKGLLTNFNLTNPEDRAQKLLALATLAGGFTSPGQANPCWMTANENLGRTEELEILFHALISLYPGKQGLQAVRPDLLGEALVGLTLRRPGADNLLDAVLSHDVDQAVRHHALTVIARLSDQRPDLHETLIDALSRHFAHCYHEILLVAVETGGDLSQLAEAAFNRLPRAAQSQLAGLLNPLLGQKSVQLASLACAVSGFLVEKAQRKYTKKKKNTKLMADYAGRLGNYSVALDRVGHNEQALVSAQKSFKLFEQLYSKKQQSYASGYAFSLNNIANRLGDAGQHEEALRRAEQALVIYQKLARINPDRYESDYAMSLNNIARRLSDVGRYEEALTRAERALEIRQRLARKNPDCYEPDYASSLNCISNLLSSEGQYKGALKHAGQAQKIYQRLARKNPDRYKSDYAISLNNTANLFSDVGQYEEALRHARQAQEIYQRLTAKHLERFADDSFSSTCEVFFLAWLINPATTGGELKKLSAILTTGLPHQDLELQFYKKILLACYASKQAARSDNFKQVIASWEGLSSADKNKNQGYWLCAAAWCAAFSPEIIADTDWQASWKQFKEQRQGNIPAWMQRTAENLSFQWPE